MILSVSRRTDIPNYYSEWFMHRIQEGFVYVRNPLNAHQISKISLSPEAVDCIVFWTKNPENMLDKLDDLKAYQYYFQFTLSGYGKDVEPNLPDKRKVMIPTFQKLSEKIGKGRVIWRYDPILLNDRYTIAYHLKAFEEIARELEDYTERAVISFVDMYTKTQRNTKALKLHDITESDMIFLAEEIAGIASRYNLTVYSCAEMIDLEKYGIEHGSCIDKELIENLIGCKLTGGKDRSQREECGCMESVEIGAYNTCLNGCRYCYANYSDPAVGDNVKMYDLDSPLLCGAVGPEDKVTERKVKSMKEPQISLFDKV